MLPALPFTTFGEIAVLCLEVEIPCPSCYHVTKIDPADDRLRDRPFTGTRFAAASALLFKRPTNDKLHEWTPIASQLLAKAPDAQVVLEKIVERLNPRGWSGSLATKFESRLKLLEQLLPSDTPGLAEAFNKAKIHLQDRIVAERKREARRGGSEGGQFE
jgi:hypothetical protein